MQIFKIRNMKKLIDIDKLGGIDADNDELLMQCFQDHEAYTNLTSFKNVLYWVEKVLGKLLYLRKFF